MPDTPGEPHVPNVPDLASHATHDRTLIAAYAAGDARGDELALASALVAGCADCGALHHDLRTISAAVAGLPAPERPRDFRLTEDQAAALRPAMAANASEPGQPQRRQGRDMPNVPDLASHATHDRTLIAAYAAGDARGGELALASALVAGCADCGALHHDLRTISAAVAGLPALERPRDFRLTEDQAAALRRSGWRGVLAALAGPKFRFAAPLGTALATVGLAALLVTGPGVPLLPSTGAGGAVRSLTTAGAGAAGPEAAPATEAPAADGTSVPQPAASAAATSRPIDITDNASGSTAAPATAAPAGEGPGVEPVGPAATPLTVTSATPPAQPIPTAAPSTGGDVRGAPSPGAAAGGGAPVASASDGRSALAGPQSEQRTDNPKTAFEASGSEAAGGTLLPAVAATMLLLGLGLGVLRIVAVRLT